MSGRLTIRADADPRMGTGHVMRMLALAQAWAEKSGQAHFVGRIEAEPLRARILAEGFGLTELTATHPDPADLAVLLEQGEPGGWVALDGYHFDTQYQRAVRASGRKSLVVDDVNDRGAYEADVLLNQNLGAEAFTYRLNPDCLRLLGPRHALLRREFLAARPADKPCPERARNILVTFGGADPDNVTGKALAALALLADPQLNVRVVVGAANPHAGSLRALATALTCPCELLQAVTNMPGLMAWADLAVSAAGSTCWELCFFGVPMLLVPIADNQAGIGPALAVAGAAVVARPEPESLAQNLRSLLGDAQARRAMSAAGHGLVDGQGARRVSAALRQ